MARRILVPTDGSPMAARGLEHALTTYPDADIVVLHVVSPHDAWGDEDPPLPEEPAAEWVDAREERAEAVLDGAREKASEHGVEVATDVAAGEPWRAIVEYAEKNDADHIVLGSHGRDDGSTRPLGSVAETVMRRAPVLVSIVR